MDQLVILLETEANNLAMALPCQQHTGPQRISDAACPRVQFQRLRQALTDGRD